MNTAIEKDKVQPLAPSVKTLILPGLAVKLALGARTSEKDGEILVFFEDNTLRVSPDDFELARKAARRVRVTLPRPDKVTATALLDAHILAHKCVSEELFKPGAVRVIYYPSLSKASAFYRCGLPASALNQGDKVAAHMSWNRSGREALDYDVVVIQIDHSKAALQFAKGLKSMGKKVVFEIDDAFDALEPWHNRYEQYKSKEEQDRVFEMMGLCDAVTVTTRTLKNRYEKRARRIEVIPNFLPISDWPKSSPHGTPEFRVLWAGSPSHEGDLNLVAEPLWDFARKHPDVRIYFFGKAPAEIPTEIFSKVRIIAFADFSEYPQKLAEVKADLAIAPLSNIPFNQAKSNSKLLEYGACGYPVIASDVMPYSETLRNRPDGLLGGLLCSTPQEWTDALELMYVNPEVRKMTREGLSRIAGEYDVFQNTRKTEEFFMSLSEVSS